MYDASIGAQFMLIQLEELCEQPGEIKFGGIMFHELPLVH